MENWKTLQTFSRSTQKSGWIRRTRNGQIDQQFKQVETRRRTDRTLCFRSLVRSQLSSNGKSSNEKAENDSLLDQRKKSRPCFPTQNDRVAFINQHTIEQRCVSEEKFDRIFILSSPSSRTNWNNIWTMLWNIRNSVNMSPWWESGEFHLDLCGIF